MKTSRKENAICTKLSCQTNTTSRHNETYTAKIGSVLVLEPKHRLTLYRGERTYVLRLQNNGTVVKIWFIFKILQINFYPFQLTPPPPPSIPRGIRIFPCSKQLWDVGTLETPTSTYNQCQYVIRTVEIWRP
jgi:hypothetical protein